MKTTWWIVLLVLVAAIALIVFLIKRNLKDEKDLIEYLENEEDINKADE
ncbi:MAG TPA: hypothetical protein PLX60_12935 [Chitinophagales bacterium]|jgi:hypothetical protein|nr:hypothetical protein [Chitinophagales bacterium]